VGVWNVLKWVLIAVVIPPLLNYTSLKSEHTALLPPTALLYDIGQGQRLMLHCTGKGAPTVILESPAGKVKGNLICIVATLKIIFF